MNPGCLPLRSTRMSGRSIASPKPDSAHQILESRTGRNASKGRSQSSPDRRGVLSSYADGKPQSPYRTDSRLYGTRKYAGEISRADLDSFTPEQQFFVAYAETWCANSTPQYLRMAAQSDPHATPKARVNGVVSNMPEFQKAFGCKTGQPMVRENACRVW
jgi:hypothetical protein